MYKRDMVVEHPHHSRAERRRRVQVRPGSDGSVRRSITSFDTMVTADDHTTYSLARSAATSAMTETILSARTLDTDAGRTVDTDCRTIDTIRTAGGSSARKKNRNTVIGLVLALCLLNIIEVDVVVDKNGGGGRRSLLSTLYLAGPSTLLPWAQHHLVDVQERPDPVAETALFWHIPKSGGTTAKRLYQCMGQTLAHRVGADPKYGHSEKDEVVVFQPHDGKDWKVVNVDTTIKAGILRAKKIGLVQSHTTDLIFTMEPNFAGRELYDEENKGRFLSLFRHPVDRAFSMFYYLQTATWERTYRPEWANMTVLEWANLPNAEEDYMVRKLVGKSFGMEADETDLIIAKELVRQRFIVGLMDDMNESIRRFNIVLGIDEESERSQKCMVEFGLVIPKETEEDTKPVEVVKKNSNSHPKFEEGSPEYDAVAGRNRLDMLLYKYVEALFEAQKEIVDSFLEDEVVAEIDEDEVDHEKEDDEIVTKIDEVAQMLEPRKTRANVEVSEKETRNLEHEEPSVGDEPQGIVLSHMADVNTFTQSDSETFFFWHVPKAGGTSVQRLYWCMGSTIANEVGINPKFGFHDSDKIVAFSPWKDNPGKVVNVDVCTHDGIVEAKNRGFLTKKYQPKVDFVSTSEFYSATKILFSPDHKARLFALFRHPIEAAVSKFYYLQKATWEPTYNKRWAGMPLEQWASQDRGENNWMVHNLIGKKMSEEVTIKDLEAAKEIIRSKFVVGLMDKFDESVHRFNILLGIDESDPKTQECIEKFSSNEGDGNSSRNKSKIVKKNQHNSYSHPTAERGSDVWISLAKIHMYDVLLYKYVMELFREQEAMFESTSSVN